MNYEHRRRIGDASLRICIGEVCFQLAQRCGSRPEKISFKSDVEFRVHESKRKEFSIGSEGPRRLSFGQFESLLVAAVEQLSTELTLVAGVRDVKCFIAVPARAQDLHDVPGHEATDRGRGDQTLQSRRGPKLGENRDATRPLRAREWFSTTNSDPRCAHGR